MKHSEKVTINRYDGKKRLDHSGKPVKWVVSVSWAESGIPGRYSVHTYFADKAAAEAYSQAKLDAIANYVPG